MVLISAPQSFAHCGNCSDTCGPCDYPGDNDTGSRPSQCKPCDRTCQAGGKGTNNSPNGVAGGGSGGSGAGGSGGGGLSVGTDPNLLVNGASGGAGCANPPCNSGVRGGAYGNVDQSFFQGNGQTGSPLSAAESGQADNGKRLMQLIRQDYFVTGNGGVPLEMARRYNNRSDNYFDNADGNTALGPRWHFAYEMRVNVVSDGNDTYVRRSDGGPTYLYYKSSGLWESDAASGESLKLERQASYFKLSTTDPNVWYRFDLTTGRLQKIRYRNGNLITLSYTGSQVTRADFDHESSDIDDRYLRFSYSNITYEGKTRSRLTHVYSGHGATEEDVCTYEYDTAHSGMLQQVNDRFGRMVEYYVNELQFSDVYQLTAIWTKDVDDNWLCRCSYVYDQHHNMIRVRDGGGMTIFRNEIGENYYTEQVIFPAHDTNREQMKCLLLNWNRKPLTTEMAVINANGTTNTTIRQKQNFTTDAGYGYGEGEGMNDTDQVKEVYESVDADGNPIGAVTKYDYLDETTTGPVCDRKYVKKITYPDETTVEFGYDSMYNVVQTTAPLGRASKSYHDSDGNLKWTQNPLGETWYYTYDSYGRLTQIEDPTSGTVQYAYNSYGNVSTTTNTEGRATTYSYDSRNRVSSVTALGVMTSYDYDEHDWLTTVTDALDNQTVHAYDALGRRISTKDPLGNATQKVYSTSNTLVNVVYSDDSRTTFTYDFYGRLTAFTNQRGKTWNYFYDEDNHLTSETTPLDKLTTYAYIGRECCSSCGSGGQGKLGQMTRADGSVTSYTYDLMSRLTRVDYVGTSDYVTFTYDDAGRRTEMTDTRLPSSDLGGQTFQWAYDALDRVTTETYPDSNTIVYGYDSLGRRTSVKDPDGNTTTYAYANTASNKKLSYINNNSLGSRIDFTYDASDGLLTQEYSTNYSQTNWTYDGLKRVQSLSTRDSYDENVNSETYTYNADSIRTRVNFTNDFTGPYEKLYSYDSLLRLTEEHERDSSSATLYRRAYTYDFGGNRTEMVNYDGSTTVTTDYTYNDGDQLTEEGDYNYSYDDNGNIIYKDDSLGEGWYWYHDSENRLYAFSEDQTWTYVYYDYDALGRRILREDWNGNKRKYYYNGLNILMVKQKPSGGSWSTKTAYVLKQAPVGQIVSAREYSGGMPNDMWYHYDLLGNVTAITDYNNGVLDKRDQEAFGNVTGGTPAGFQLTTKEYDSDAGLYYFNARWYDCASAQFYEKAPMHRSREHPYGFVLNLPTARVDATGRIDDYFPPFDGNCCNHSGEAIWVLVANQWIILRDGQCTETDCDGMQCGGVFYPASWYDELDCRRDGCYEVDVIWDDKLDPPDPPIDPKTRGANRPCPSRKIKR